MRRALALIGFSTLLVFTAGTTFAQADRFAYAITDVTKEGSGWNALRRIDLQTGTYSPLLLKGAENAVAYDAVTKKELAQQPDARYGNLLQMPFGTGVAAAAYDKKHKRLYYTPMYIDQLRYIDLKTMKVFYVTNQPFTGLGHMHNNDGQIITRMVIAPDGNGYAISNNGKSFIKFTTGKNITITQLGPLQDDAANSISIHERQSSYGGDMIADDEGNLYILTARNQVFKVNTETKMAKYLGFIEGLPQSFTVNGAVVNAEGDLLVSSAVDGKSYYVVDPASWKAASYAGATGVYRSSDLANSNFLSSARTTTIETIVDRKVLPGNNIQVYPNPVTANRFTVQFRQVQPGDYTVELMDIAGRSVMQKRITIEMKDQTQSFNLKPSYSKGAYLLRLVNRNSQTVHEQKVVVQ